MANSYTSVTGTGVLQTVTVPAYIDQAHIKVNINNVDFAGFSWVNASTVSLTAPLGSFVKVFRSTSPNTRLVDFIDGVPLDEVTLDTDSKQAFYLAQEQLDATQDALLVIGQPNFQAIADDITAKSVLATSGAAAATTQAGIATTQAGNAAASVTSAATQATNAAASAVTAAAQVSAATTQANNAAASATAAAGSATTASGSATAAGTQATNAAASATSAAGSATAAAASAASASPNPSVRQTVLSGPVDTNGLSAYGSTGTGTATLTATGTLDITCMAGGETNRRGTLVNGTFPSPGGTGTGFLVAQISAGGVVTTAVRSLAQTVSYGTASSIVNGQMTISVKEGLVRVGNGAATVQAYEVFIGECAHTAGVWSGTPTWYTQGDEINTPEVACVTTATLTTFSHRFGLPNVQPELYLRCLTAQAGVTVGEVFNGVLSISGTAYSPLQPRQTDRNTVTVRTADSFAYAVFNATTGAASSITPANFNQFANIKRGF